MGFFVYEYGAVPCASPGYQLLRSVNLAGSALTAIIAGCLPPGTTLPTPPPSAPPGGTLSGCLSPQGLPSASSPCPSPIRWCATDADLLSHLGYTHPDHRLVVDMKPNVPSVVSLYELKKVWGVTYVHGNPWTVVMLQLEALWVDYHPPVGTSVTAFKACFPDPPRPRALVHEFLYLNYRVPPRSRSGVPTWLWGPSGMVNAPVLFEDALTYFIPHLRHELLRHSETDVCVGCSGVLPPPTC